MTGDGSTVEHCFRDLHDDLLGAIYRRCLTTYDRARFVAVCKSWRAAASWQPKLPGLPLLLNSTGNGAPDRKARAYSPEDGRVLHAPLPWFPYGKRIVGCHDGGWVAAVEGWWIEVVNLFTLARVLRKRYIDDTFIQKIIFSNDPSSSEGCILAVLDIVKRVKLYRIGGPGLGGWTSEGCGLEAASVLEPIADIAFSNGHLYCLTYHGDLLYKLAARPNKGYPPVVVISLEKLIIQRHAMKFGPQYIFELRGKLATAVEVTPPVSNDQAARSFRVFELAASTESSKYTWWAEVTSLGDHALFLGPRCCKAVHVSVAGTRGRGDLQGNCIYYSKNIHGAVYSKCLARLDLGSCFVYCYESDRADDSDERIMSRGFHYHEKEDGITGRNRCTWILPPNF
jgi:hypothetical protein